ncbi:MAG: hypothetical protein IJ834_08620 [Paludibacteraceae bacterium]|nr:hypothetical protein [Paludibacteraceae bacterium]
MEVQWKYSGSTAEVQWKYSGGTAEFIQTASDPQKGSLGVFGSFAYWQLLIGSFAYLQLCLLAVQFF